MCNCMSCSFSIELKLLSFMTFVQCYKKQVPQIQELFEKDCNARVACLDLFLCPL